MVIAGSPTKPVAEVKPTSIETEAVGKEEIVTKADVDSQDSDTEFTVETAEMEELDESSSDSDGNDEEEAEPENFTIEVEDGKARKLKFPPIGDNDTQENDTQETETQETQGLEVLENTMDDEDDENDNDFNPCHDTLSDIDVNEDDEMAESDPEVEEDDGVHKKTGATHQRIKVKNQMEVPPAEFESAVTADQPDEPESDSKMEE